VQVFFAVEPYPCKDIPQCVLALDNEPTNLISTPQSRIAALSVLLAKEFSTLVYAHYEVPEMQTVASGFSKFRTSLLLMCIVLAVKIVSELAFAVGSTWPFAVPPMTGMLEDWGVVHALRFVDWIVTVPLLLVLCGHYVLRRPMSEVIGPALASSCYAYLAGMAMVASSLISRILLMMVAFAAYFWVSVEMIRWAYRFLCHTSREVPRRIVRVVFSVGLVLFFGLYGIIYLLAIHGVISSATESEFYARGDVLCKISISFLIANVNEAERQHALRDLLFQSHDMSSACLSLLRGSFDHVLPCSLDDFGDLIIDADAQGVEYLETILGRPVRGLSFNDLIVAQTDRERFEAYARHTPQNTQCAPKCGIPYHRSDTGFSQLLEMPQAAMANVFLCDLAGRAEYTLTGQRTFLAPNTRFRAKIFLSAIDHRPSSDASLAEQRMVIALDIQEVLQSPSFESLPSTISTLRLPESQASTFTSLPKVETALRVQASDVLE